MLAVRFSDFDPICDIGCGNPVAQQSLPYRGVVSFRSEAREVRGVRHELKRAEGSDLGVFVRGPAHTKAIGTDLRGAADKTCSCQPFRR
jgi:hypothetical protein